jgi:thiamine-monophosphate kinase
MKIKELGGEFALIERIKKSYGEDSRVIKGIGDDCAVIRAGNGKLQLVTTDMMVENDHFKTAWYSPAQIGMKLMEGNVSDVVSMGGAPSFAFLSMCVTADTSVEFMDGFYRGLYGSAEEHGVLLLGGDTTHGRDLVFNLALVGEADPGLLQLRSGAHVRDLLCVTGTLGGSAAGLGLLSRGMTGHLSDHLEPKSRKVWEGKTIAEFATAMIDVSDGLASEVSHLCRESGTGGRIDYPAIPISAQTAASAGLLGADARDFALYGGEDFQLVFTLPPVNLGRLRERFADFTVVGEILPESEGLHLAKDGLLTPLGKGYDHFA